MRDDFYATGLSVIFNSSTKGDAGLLGTRALDVAWFLFGVGLLFFIMGRAIKKRRVLLHGHRCDYSARPVLLSHGGDPCLGGFI